MISGLLVLGVLWAQFIALSFAKPIARMGTYFLSLLLLAGVGGFLANADIVGRLIVMVNNRPAVHRGPLTAQLHFAASVYRQDGHLLLDALLLLEPLIAALVILFVGVQLRRRGFAWLAGLFQIGLWGFILVLVFAAGYADVHASYGVWLVDGHPQRMLRLSQAQYFSYQMFLSFSFGDIVPSLGLVHGSVPTIAGLVAQMIQLEAVIGHIFWVGVVSSFIGLFWTPPNRGQMKWYRWTRKLNPCTWHRPRRDQESTDWLTR